MAGSHPRLDELVARARRASGTPGTGGQGSGGAALAAATIGLVYPGDALAAEAAQHIAEAGIARPVLIGPAEVVRRACASAGVDAGRFEIVDVGEAEPAASAARAVALAREGQLAGLMKGSLHTDELMSAIVKRHTGLRGDGTRISHAFLFDLPRYPKLLALADCVVNIAPDLRTKQDIVGNAVTLLQTLGIAAPKVGIVAATEVVNPAIPATLDADALVKMSREQGAWPGAIVEGPFGFDNAISAESARIKKIESRVSGDADLLVLPDLNAANILYKSFVYIGGGDCAGLVLGAKVPIVLTSRADSLQSRVASVALAVLAAAGKP